MCYALEKIRNVKRIFVVKPEDHLKALGAEGRIILKRTFIWYV